ncbi:hypothetical protein HRG_011010 [Hirsutella rhossiliensis]|uniref:Uncharacterized protein n=1 Tax=Hirsutella rhossiliensis TaxID=111463 RepID=A0A9P8MM98_9HYPO|nr:uncharacterized protein HRG_11010 [Hirsutella rhossiliensis]KAH0957917.1 hypothetical protein HRG_11010 [Hirsutella rhossiliensis]
MPGPYDAQVHQAPREASVGSSYGTYSRSSASYAPSSAASSVPRSASSGIRRVYGATEHTAQVARSSNGTTVINHNRTGYQSGSPTPGYSGAYAAK